MKDLIHDGSEVNRPNNALEIYLEGTRQRVAEAGASHQFLHLQGEQAPCEAYREQGFRHPVSSEGYLHPQRASVFPHADTEHVQRAFNVDFVTFKIVDKKVMKRTAVQEQVIFPLRAYNYVTEVAGKKDGRTVFTFDKFTIPEDKMLVVELNEKSGGRHQSFTMECEDIVRARVINELKVR